MLFFEVRVYIDAEGKEPFRRWLENLDVIPAGKVTAAIERMSQSNLGGAKSVGAGVMERRIEWGPGYRVYFGRDGARLVILLGGGTKKRQWRDIEEAKSRWEDYKQRRNRGEE